MTTPTSDDAGSFELRIDFSGVCMFVVGKEARNVTVLLPDGRSKGQRPQHRDGQPAEPHVATLAFDLANFESSLTGLPPTEPTQEPLFEVVHQLDREEITLPELPLIDVPQEDVSAGIEVPNFSVFAPLIELEPTALDHTKESVLCHLVLRGGRFETLKDEIRRNLPGHLHPEHKDTEGLFGAAVRWQRQVKGDALIVQLVPYAGGQARTIRLLPTTAPNDVPAITLKIGNLCENPLDWRNLDYPPERAEADEDFKWAYTLMRPAAASPDVDFKTLPIPTPLEEKRREGKVDRCFGARIDTRA